MPKGYLHVPAIIVIFLKVIVANTKAVQLMLGSLFNVRMDVMTAPAFQDKFFVTV